MEQRKRCSRCGRDQVRSKFGANCYRGDGLQAWCKECARADQAERRKADREAAVLVGPEAVAEAATDNTESAASPTPDGE